MKKSPELKEFQSKEPSLTIMPLKLKSNIFQKKSKRLSLNTNQSKEFGKEFNIYQLKPKSSTTQKETITSRAKANTSRPVMLKEVTPPPVPPTFHPKVESELKLFTKPVTFQSHHQLFKDQLLDKVDSSKVPLNMLLDQLMPKLTPLVQFIQLVKPTPLDKLTLPDKPTLPEVVELEEKMSTDNHKLEAMSLVEVESDNDFIKFHFITIFLLFLLMNLNNQKAKLSKKFS